MSMETLITIVAIGVILLLLAFLGLSTRKREIRRTTFKATKLTARAYRLPELRGDTRMVPPESFSFSAGGSSPWDFFGSVVDRLTGSSDEPSRRRSGQALFKVPKTMWLDVPERVNLRISPEQVLSMQALKELRGSMNARGENIQIKPVDLGARMEAVLHVVEGNFDVTELSSKAQDTDFEKPLSWDWSVTPSSLRSALLRVQISMVQDAQGEEHRWDVEKFTQRIEVEPKAIYSVPLSMARRNPEYFFGSSLFVLIGALYGAYTVLFVGEPPKGD